MTVTVVQPDTAPRGVPRVADICGVDLSSPETFIDGPPHAAFDALRARAVVAWQDEREHRSRVAELRTGLPTPPSPGFWVITSHAEAQAVLRDAVTFSSELGGVLMTNVDELSLAGLRMILINMDDPRHALQRKLLSPFFTPRLIEAMRGHVEGNARDIAREFVRAGGGDFVSDVAVELTVRVLANLLGIPHEERGRVLQWAKISDVESPGLEDGGAAVIALMADLFEYAKGVRAGRRAQPTGDLMSLLASATVDGVEFTEDEFCWFYLMLIMAGTETTRYSLAGAVRSLDETGQWAQLAGGTVSATVVDELLRYVSPVMHMRRTATRDVELGGQRIRAGDKVVVWMNAANRDPAVFDHPHRIDLAREHNPHLVFGHGAHFCLGTRLARLQLASMLGELAQTCPGLRVVGPAERMPSTFMDAVVKLPVEV
ncbi:cytochrome P450 [Mycolicibacterium sp. 050232]|uniref:cytochrome P450 n=1 Tax=Mycolicibacterium sp. 050232 TaxID=3113982 RepID=UPI002E2C0B72|nr:cytochrome P450 [Mycolicibacterium sp. 050232]MED5814407.1 cytochrome P450 [Mycolicibacterium sp. 050232]